MADTNRERNIQQLKKKIRAERLSARDSILAPDKARYDQKIKEAVTSMTKYQEADVILAYASYRSEADTVSLTKQALIDGKSVFVPKVSGGEMEFWRIAAVEELQAGYRGIPEPVRTTAFPAWLMEEREFGRCGNRTIKVMMWMPGVAFDKERRRIGYGGGFYDRYLEHMEDWKTRSYGPQDGFAWTVAALAYTCQIVEEIPWEEHDRKPDLVVTEKEIVS